MKDGGIWDHRDPLEDMRALVEEEGEGEEDMNFPIRGYEGGALYYDVWSNIHYGYAGSPIGFDPWLLHEAPGEAGSIQDEADYISEQIGLWNVYGLDLTQQQLHQAILDAMPLYEAAALVDAPQILQPASKGNGF